MELVASAQPLAPDVCCLLSGVVLPSPRDPFFAKSRHPLIEGKRKLVISKHRLDTKPSLKQ